MQGTLRTIQLSGIFTGLFITIFNKGKVQAKCTAQLRKKKIQLGISACTQYYMTWIGGKENMISMSLFTLQMVVLY